MKGKGINYYAERSNFIPLDVLKLTHILKGNEQTRYYKERNK